MKKKVNNINELSFSEKLAQLIFPRLDLREYEQSDSYRSFIHQCISYSVGGFCIFNGSIESISRIINELQSKSKIPLLFCADFEFGSSMRLEGGSSYPHNFAVGLTNNTKNAHFFGKSIAQEAKILGIHWLLAPVCDIFSNPDNPVINIRSYAANEKKVSNFASEFIVGTQECNVLACSKHFPGHGDTSLDSHFHLPEVNHKIDRLQTFEFVPFIEAIKVDVKSIMVAHIAVPEIDDTNLPASLSKAIVTCLLRKKLGFKGIITTDALDMKAITDNYSNLEAAKLAIFAGNNVLLMPPDPIAIIKESENLFPANERPHIAQSAEMIIEQKIWAGLYTQETPNINFNNLISHNQTIALEIALQSKQVIGNQSLLPIDSETAFTGLGLILKDNLDPALKFFNYLANAISNNCDICFIDERFTEEDAIYLTEETNSNKLAIFAVFCNQNTFNKPDAISNELLANISRITKLKTTIAVYFANTSQKPLFEADLNIFMYSDSLPSIAAAVMVLSGRD